MCFFNIFFFSYLPACWFVWLVGCLCVLVFVCVFVALFVCLFACLFVCLFGCVFGYLCLFCLRISSSCKVRGLFCFVLLGVCVCVRLCCVCVCVSVLGGLFCGVLCSTSPPAETRLTVYRRLLHWKSTWHMTFWLAGGVKLTKK